MSAACRSRSSRLFDPVARDHLLTRGPEMLEAPASDEQVIAVNHLRSVRGGLFARR